MKYNISDKFKNKEEEIEVEILSLAPTLDLERDQVYFCKLTYSDNSVVYDAYCQELLDKLFKLLN